MLVLPGQNVTVMDASNAEFQAFINTRNLSIENDEGRGEWSFDDRIGVINHYRKYGVDLFAEPNKNNSEPEQKQFGNNSETELFDTGEQALKPHPEQGTPILDGWTAIIKGVVGEPTKIELRDDIDLLLAEIKNSSSCEQKEFEGE